MHYDATGYADQHELGDDGSVRQRGEKRQLNHHGVESTDDVPRNDEEYNSLR